MMKEKYELSELEIIRFLIDDVIMTSVPENIDYEEDETPLSPVNS